MKFVSEEQRRWMSHALVTILRHQKSGQWRTVEELAETDLHHHKEPDLVSDCFSWDAAQPEHKRHFKNRLRTDIGGEPTTIVEWQVINPESKHHRESRDPDEKGGRPSGGYDPDEKARRRSHGGRGHYWRSPVTRTDQPTTGGSSSSTSSMRPMSQEQGAILLGDPISKEEEEEAERVRSLFRRP